MIEDCELYYLNEVDDLLHAVLVEEAALLGDDHVVVLFGASDDPLQVLDADLVVHGNEEGLVSARETPIQVQNPAIHVVSDHESVPEIASEDCQRHDHEDGEVDANDTVVTRLFKPDIELKHVTVLEILRAKVRNQYDEWVEYGEKASPRDHFVEVLRVALQNHPDYARRGSCQCKYDTVSDGAGCHYDSDLLEVPSGEFKLASVP